MVTSGFNSRAASAPGIISILFFLLFTVSCSEVNEPGTDIAGHKDLRLTYGAACQSDTLRLKYSDSWAVTSYPDWISLPVTEAVGDIKLPVNIQQNDDGVARDGRIVIRLADNRQQCVYVTQNPGEDNGGIQIDLQNTYALGWGYDLREDVADVAGIRGQVFDSAALTATWGDNAVVTENNAATNLYFVNAQSSESLQQKMSTTVSAGVDAKVASAKVTVEYDKQISEQKDRLYVWCRDMRVVRLAYFNNDVGILGRNVVSKYTTSSFRRSVAEDTPAEFVRKFGTHLVVKSFLGGKLDYYFTVSSDITTEVTEIVKTINVKLLCFKTSSSSVDENVWKEIKKDFQGNFVVSGGGEYGRNLNSKLQQYAAKGEPLTDQSLFDNWYGRFKDPEKAIASELAMVNFEIIPIWNFVNKIDRSKAMEIKQYVTEQYFK